MEVERKKGNKLRITEQSASCRDFRPKALKLYRELLVFIENDPKLKLLFVQRKTKC